MELNDWILALHLLSAFAMVGAVVLFWILIVGELERRHSRVPSLRLSPVARVGVAAVTIGSVGTIVFGLWLAISLEAYQPWDGWVIAAIVLWAVAGGVGGALGQGVQRRRRSVPPSCRQPARRARTPSCLRSTGREPA